MGKTVLAVDDSASVRQMVQFTMESAGYSVITASDGAEGVEKAKAEKVDFIIADLNMPRMDGISMIKEIRKLPAHKFTPIVLLTTESQPEKKAEGKAAGATGWIVKPFKQDQLTAVAKKLVG